MSDAAATKTVSVHSSYTSECTDVTSGVPVAPTAEEKRAPSAFFVHFPFRACLSLPEMEGATFQVHVHMLVQLCGVCGG